MAAVAAGDDDDDALEEEEEEEEEATDGDAVDDDASLGKLERFGGMFTVNRILFLPAGSGGTDEDDEDDDAEGDADAFSLLKSLMICRSGTDVDDPLPRSSSVTSPVLSS